MNRTDLSVVIAVYNEEDGLDELYVRLTRALQKIGRSYEIILVDDGSRDRSLDVMLALRAKDPEHVKPLSFTRNFGQHIALTAGLDHAFGEVVVMMDADLQDQPEEMHKLLAKLDEGYDVVYGDRQERQHSWYKSFTSRSFLWIMNRVVRSQVTLDSSIYRAMRKPIADDLRSMRERARYLPGMVRWIGYRQTSTPVQHGKRFAGTTKYSIWTLMKLALSTATGFSAAPLQFATVTGMVTAALALVFLVYVVIRKLLGEYHVLGYASTMFAISFFGALQLIVIGLMGEYVSRIYGEAQGRPLYLLRVLRSDPESPSASNLAVVAKDTPPTALNMLDAVGRSALQRSLEANTVLPLSRVLPDVSSAGLARYYLTEWEKAPTTVFTDEKHSTVLVYQPLEWDTNILGMRTGRILYSASGDREEVSGTRIAKLRSELSRLVRYATKEGVQLIDARVSNDDFFVMRAFEESGFHSVDMLVTLAADKSKFDRILATAEFSYNDRKWQFQNGLSVRPLRHEEESELAELSGRTFGERDMIHDRFYLEPSISEERAALLFTTWFRNLAKAQYAGRGVVLVAELDGKPVGYVALEPMPAIDGIQVWKDSLNAVDSAARSRGVYKSLILASVDHVAREGGHVLITKTQSSTYRVINTWLHLGCDIRENFATLHWVRS